MEMLDKKFKNLDVYQEIVNEALCEAIGKERYIRAAERLNSQERANSTTSSKLQQFPKRQKKMLKSSSMMISKKEAL